MEENSSNVTPISKSQELSEDLKNQLHAIRCLAATYNLLDTGFFNVKNLEVLRGTVHPFIHSLYENSVRTALQHPDANRSQELMHLKSVIKVNDGEALCMADAEKKTAAEIKRIKKSAKRIKNETNGEGPFYA